MRIYKSREQALNEKQVDITKIPLCQSYIDLIISVIYEVQQELNIPINTLDKTSFINLINNILEERLSNG